MGNRQIVLSGKELVKVLEKIGFVVVRVNGSHHRMKHIKMEELQQYLYTKMMIYQKD